VILLPVSRESQRRKASRASVWISDGQAWPRCIAGWRGENSGSTRLTSVSSDRLAATAMRTTGRVSRQ
jgi:hypothetical protein